MTSRESLFVIGSEGVINFYYSTRCVVEEDKGVVTLRFFDSGMNPPEILSIAESEKTFAVFFSNYDENKERTQNRLEYFDFGAESGRDYIDLDFKAFAVRLLRAGAERKETESGIRIDFRGFMTKDNRKTDTMRFYVEILTKISVNH